MNHDQTDFERLADTLPDLIGKYSVNGDILYFNVALRKFLQVVDMETCRGKRPNDIWPDMRFDDLQNKILECGKTGKQGLIEIRIPNDNGGVLEYHQIRITPERDNGKIKSVIVFGRDLSELMKLQEKMTQNSRLIGLGQMAGGIAHEINNPLAIIHLTSYKLKKAVGRQQLTAELVNNSTDTIIATVSRISNIIKGLKSISRDGTKDPFVEICIDDVLRDCLSVCEEKIRSKSIQLIFKNLFSGSKVFVEGSATQLSQVFINLINNSYDAVKSMPDAWISLEQVEQNGYIEILITDSGKGISKETSKFIMEPFFTTKPVGHIMEF